MKPCPSHPKSQAHLLRSIIFLLSFFTLTAGPALAVCPPNQLEVPGSGCIPYPAQAGPRGMGTFQVMKLGEFVGALLPYILVFSGLAMLVYLLYGGFQLMIAAGDPKGIQEGQHKITHALIGFIVVFIAYWLAQILQVVFHVSIVSPI